MCPHPFCGVKQQAEPFYCPACCLIPTVRKTLQFIPAYRNVEEIEKITTLIRECTSPSFIILLGHYAGMNLYSVQEGYEFLILTEESSTIRSSEIYHYLNEHPLNNIIK